MAQSLSSSFVFFSKHQTTVLIEQNGTTECPFILPSCIFLGDRFSLLLKQKSFLPPPHFSSIVCVIAPPPLLCAVYPSSGPRPIRRRESAPKWAGRNNGKIHRGHEKNGCIFQWRRLEITSGNSTAFHPSAPDIPSEDFEVRGIPTSPPPLCLNSHEMRKGLQPNNTPCAKCGNGEICVCRSLLPEYFNARSFHPAEHIFSRAHYVPQKRVQGLFSLILCWSSSFSAASLAIFAGGPLST